MPALKNDLQDRPQDQHVMPCYGREHLTSTACPCLPVQIEVASGAWEGPTGARIFVHHEDN